MDDPGELLAGPRGRRLCLELVRAVARDAGTAAGQEYLVAGASAAYDLDPGRGRSRVVARAGGLGQDAPGPVRRFTLVDVGRLLAAVPLDQIGDRVLLEALVAAVDNARYWQEPDGEDVFAATGPLREVLRRVAATVASSSAAAWWSTVLDRAGQWTVAFPDPASQVVATAGEHLARWRAGADQEETIARRERPADPRAPWSGTWWSTPPSGLTRTTRRLGALGPVGLWAVEDGFGWDRADVRAVVLPDDTRVYELDGPQAWAHLCRRYPLEVTASRRHDWYRTTGMTGSWVVPDWSRAAAELDAVHLTVNGYLQAAGRAIAVGPGISSVLAGWNPDETYWLADDALATGAARTWVPGDDHTWREELR